MISLCCVGCVLWSCHLEKFLPGLAVRLFHPISTVEAHTTLQNRHYCFAFCKRVWRPAQSTRQASNPSPVTRVMCLPHACLCSLERAKNCTCSAGWAHTNGLIVLALRLTKCPRLGIQVCYLLDTAGHVLNAWQSEIFTNVHENAHLNHFEVIPCLFRTVKRF